MAKPAVIKQARISLVDWGGGSFRWASAARYAIARRIFLPGERL